MVYVIAFFVLVFFSIFCGWIVAAMIDEEEARELEEKEEDKSLEVQISELREEIQNLKKINEELREAMKIRLMRELTGVVEKWKN